METLANNDMKKKKYKYQHTMKTVKKLIRIIIAIVIGIPTYPLFALGYSVFGIFIFMPLVIIVGYAFKLLGNYSKKELEECKEAFEMLGFPFFSPLMFWYVWIATGRFYDPGAGYSHYVVFNGTDYYLVDSKNHNWKSSSEKTVAWFESVHYMEAEQYVKELNAENFIDEKINE